METQQKQERSRQKASLRMIDFEGEILFYLPQKGFGFARLLNIDGGGDVYVHMNSLIDPSNELKKGLKIKFNLRVGKTSQFPTLQNRLIRKTHKQEFVSFCLSEKANLDGKEKDNRKRLAKLVAVNVRVGAKKAVRRWIILEE